MEEVHNVTLAFADFADYHFYIVESDSSDGTVRVLQLMEESHDNFDFISLGNLTSRFPRRIDRLAYCRNFAQEMIRSRYSTYDYICVADLDGTNSLLTLESIRSCWFRLDWDVCTANQIGPYYDIYALRHPVWSKEDYWKEVDQLESLGVHPMKARRVAVHEKQRRIPSESNWIEVDSAFGGLAIYSRDSFFAGVYLSQDKNG